MQKRCIANSEVGSIFPNSTNDMRTPKMIKVLFCMRLVFSLFLFSLLIQASCKEGLYFDDMNHVKGYVIGSENCTNNDDEYWLIDLTFFSDTPQYGDTLNFNGTSYKNVVKTKGLNQRLRQIGMKVSFDFKVISTEKVETTGCTVSNPTTFKLKELFIINQSEIR